MLPRRSAPTTTSRSLSAAPRCVNSAAIRKDFVAQNPLKVTDTRSRTTSRAAGGAHRDAAAAARRLDGGDRGGPLQRAPRPGGGPPDPSRNSERSESGFAQ